MTDQLTFDYDRITPRMLVDFKTKTGMSLLALMETEMDLSTAEPEIVAGFIWLAMRMGPNPDATWDEALDTPFTSLDLTDGGQGPPDPSPASSTTS